MQIQDFFYRVDIMLESIQTYTYRTQTFFRAWKMEEKIPHYEGHSKVPEPNDGPQWNYACLKNGTIHYYWLHYESGYRAIGQLLVYY